MTFSGKIKELEIKVAEDGVYPYVIMIDHIKQSVGIATSSEEGEITITGNAPDGEGLPSGLYPDEDMEITIDEYTEGIKNEYVYGEFYGVLNKASRNTDKTITYNIKGMDVSAKMELPDSYKYKLTKTYKVSWAPEKKAN